MLLHTLGYVPSHTYIAMVRDVVDTILTLIFAVSNSVYVFLTFFAVSLNATLVRV